MELVGKLNFFEADKGISEKIGLSSNFPDFLTVGL